MGSKRGVRWANLAQALSLSTELGAPVWASRGPLKMRAETSRKERRMRFSERAPAQRERQNVCREPCRRPTRVEQLASKVCVSRI
jgi:hypothetical protein